MPALLDPESPSLRCRWHYTWNARTIRSLPIAREGFEHVTSICGWFPLLATVRYYITVSETGIRSLDGMWPLVTNAGGVNIEDNPALMTFGNALPALTTVATDFRVTRNPNLETLGSSFSVRQLRHHFGPFSARSAAPPSMRACVLCCLTC